MSAPAYTTQRLRCGCVTVRRSGRQPDLHEPCGDIQPAFAAYRLAVREAWDPSRRADAERHWAACVRHIKREASIEEPVQIRVL